MTKLTRVAFASVVQSRGSGASGLPQSAWAADGKYPVIGQGAEFIEGWTNRDDLVLSPKPAVVLYGGHTRRAKFVDTPFVPGPNVKILEPSAELDARYLYHYLAQLPIASRGYADHFTEVRRCMVPLPSRVEQLRIARILDKAVALREKRRASITKLDNLTQSVFLELFGDPIRNEKGWPDGMPLGELADIVSGVTKGRSVIGKSTRRVPYLAVVNVQDRVLDLSGVKTIEATEEEIRRLRLLPNDLLLTEGGDPDKLGRGTLWSGELAECIHQNHIFRVRLTTTSIHPWFLNWLVGSQRGKRYFLRSAKQTTGIASINMTQLRAFPVLQPTIEMQRDFARRAAAVEKLAKVYRTSLLKIEGLISSIQERAFLGEL